MRQGGVFPYYATIEGDRVRVGYRVLWPDLRGQLREKKLRGIPKSAAIALWRSKVVTAVTDEAGETCPADRVTLAEHFEVFLRARLTGAAQDDLRVTTVEKERELFDLHLRPALGRAVLARIDAAAVASMLEGLRNRARFGGTPGAPLGKASKVRVERLLNQICRHAARAGVFGPKFTPKGAWKKPWDAPPKPSKRTKREALRGADEIAHVIDRAFRQGGIQFATAMGVTIACGLRRSELRHLQWGRDVRRTPDGAWEVTVQADTAKSRDARTMLVRGSVAELLDAWSAKRPSDTYVFAHERSWTKWENRDGTRVEVNYVRGQPYSRDVIPWARWKRLARNAGIPETMRFHDAGRGSFIKNLGARGDMSLPEVASAAGHKDVHTTLGYLWDTRGADAERVAATFGPLTLPLAGIAPAPMLARETPDLTPPEKFPSREIPSREIVPLAGTVPQTGVRTVPPRETETGFAARLRMAREGAGWLQRDLGKRLAVELPEASEGAWQQVVSHLERGGQASAERAARLGPALVRLLGVEGLRDVPKVDRARNGRSGSR